MKITKNNYEIYFIDYFDGMLSDADTRMLFDFLHQHPELKEEFESFDQTPLKADENIVFKGKSKMKQAEIIPHHFINETNYEDYFIAFAEQDLSPEEKEKVLAFLFINPQLEKVFNGYHQLKVNPDLSIQYPYKEALKRSSKKGIIFWMTPYVALAASFILLFGLYFIFSGQFSNKHTEEIFSLASIDSKNIENDGQIAYAETLEKRTSTFTLFDIYQQNQLEKEVLISNNKPLRTTIEAFQVASLPYEDLAMDVDKTMDEKMNYRYHATIRYLYKKHKSDKSYRLELLAYQEKNNVGKIIYHVTNRWLKKDQTYIVSPSEYEFIEENTALVKALAENVKYELSNLQAILLSPKKNFSYNTKDIKISY